MYILDYLFNKMWFKNKKKATKEKESEKPFDLTEIMFLAEPMCDNLERKNLGRFLEKDFIIEEDRRYLGYLSANDVEENLRPYLKKY